VFEHGVGEIYPGGDVAQLAERIDKILYHPELREKYHQAAIVASKTLHWGVEKETLIRIYQELLLNLQREAG
jgi:glycosyltransferase involved in cell wall biosynthesis